VSYESFQRGLAASCLWVYVGGAISVSMACASSCSQACRLISSLCKVGDWQRMKGFRKSGMVIFKVRRIYNRFC